MDQQKYFIDRKLICRNSQEPGMVETLSKNITRQGLTATTLNYLRVSSTVSNIEPVMDTETAGVGGAAGAGPSGASGAMGGAPAGIDPDSLPLPSAHTLTGQNIPTSTIDNLDFGSDSFQFQ